jgi:hypothetical protein
MAGIDTDPKTSLGDAVHKLAAMDSEQLLRQMNQKNPPQIAPEVQPDPNGRRTSRKRTKTARALESEQLEAEFEEEAKASRKAARNALTQETLFASQFPPGEHKPTVPMRKPDMAAVPSLFKPAEDPSDVAKNAGPPGDAQMAAEQPAPLLPKPTATATDRKPEGDNADNADMSAVPAPIPGADALAEGAAGGSAIPPPAADGAVPVPGAEAGVEKVEGAVAKDAEVKPEGDGEVVRTVL